MRNAGFHSRRSSFRSTSAPARNVSTMPAKPPMKSIQGVGRRPKTFAPTTPRPISMIATEMPISTETIEATRIRAARIVAVARSDMPLHDHG